MTVQGRTEAQRVQAREAATERAAAAMRRQRLTSLLPAFTARMEPPTPGTLARDRRRRLARYDAQLARCSGCGEWTLPAALWVNGQQVAAHACPVPTVEAACV